MPPAPERRQTASASPTPDTFALAKGDEEEEVQAKAQEDGTGEQVSAADYDPCLDRREDEHKRVWGTKEEPQDVEMIEEEEDEEEEDVDDMFAVATTEKKKVKKVKRVVVSVPLGNVTLRTHHTSFTSRNLLRRLSSRPPSTRPRILRDITKSFSGSNSMEGDTKFSLLLARACSRTSLEHVFFREMLPKWARKSQSRLYGARNRCTSVIFRRSTGINSLS